MSDYTFIIDDVPARVKVPTISIIPPPTTQHPSYKLVGRNTTDTFTNKTLTSPTNNVAANSLLVGNDIVTVNGTVNPGDVLTAVDSTHASFLPSSGGGGGPSASATQIVYVRGGGSNITGDGTITKPYASITYAMSTITDALWEKRYMIDLGPGNWADNFSWKAWVFIRGSTTLATRLTGTIDINDPSWAVAGSHSDERSGGLNLNFSGTMTLDFAAVSSLYGKFYFWQCNMNNLLLITGFHPVNQVIAENGFWFSGITVSGCNVTFNAVDGQGGTVTMNSSPTASAFTAYGGGQLGNLVVNYVSDLAPVTTLIDSPVLGNITLSGAGVVLSATNSSLPVQGNIILNGGASLTRLTDAYSLGYSPTVPSNWLVVPNNVTTALDTLATTTFIDSNTHIVDIIDNTKRLGFDVGGTSGTTTTLATQQTTNKIITTPDIAGTLLVSETGTEIVYIGGPTTALHGSGSGVQYSSIVSSRAQYRCNQYGNATGVPGISTFKSRGATLGSLAPVQVGDVIYRATAVGVTDNLSIPLSGLISINVNAVPVGQGYIGTDYELQLVSVDGPANGRRVVYMLDSEGRQRFLETTSPGSHTTVPSGVVTLVGGVATVLNSKIPANARIMLTIQPGTAPLGTVYVSNITLNTSFTITSTNAGDTCNVYYRISIPL